MIRTKPVATFALMAALFSAAALGGAVFAAQTGAGVPEEIAASVAPAPGDAQPQILDARTIDLGEAYPSNPAATGQIFRARKIVLAPGARTEALSVEGEGPAIYYVTAGEVVERRDDTPPARRALHAAGIAASTMPLVLENASSEPAEILLVDISPER